MFLKKYKNSFLFGILGGLAFPPLYIIFTLPFSFYYIINKLIKLNVSRETKKFKSAFLYGIFFGFGYYLIQLYWISFSLLVDFKTYFWLIPFAISLIPLACAVYFAFSTLMFFYLVQKFKSKNKFLITLIFALSYVVFEYLRGLIFPWNLFAYTLGFSDILIQIVYYINTYMYGFILIVFFCFSYVFFEYKNKKIYFIKNNKYYIFFYLFILFFVLIFGFIRLKNANSIKFNSNFRIVQANISQNLKWDQNEVKKNLQKHLDMTTSKGYEYADIIICAESSIPYIIENKANLHDYFKNIKNKIIISGAIRGEIHNKKIEKIWNSIFIFQNGKILNYYDKSVLVPFGEYIPFSKYIPFIKKIAMGGGLEFSKGEKNKTIKTNNIKISPLICYEIIFPNKAIDKKDPPNLIINLTNDAWFGKSSGPYQHFIATKFRAVENKIPIIRSSNNGISAYINEYGQIKNKTKLNTDTVLDIKFKN